MVINLIKKDLKDSAKYFIPIILLSLSLTVLSIFPDLLHSYIERRGLRYDHFESVTEIIWILVMVLRFALIGLSAFAVLKVLYQNIYNERGYELFTLPVNSWEILVSKLVSTIIWLAVVLISYYFAFNNLFFYSLDFNWVNLVEPIKEIFSSFYELTLFTLVSFNTFLFGLGICLTIMFAGAFVYSKYVQKYRSFIVAVIVAFVFIIVLQSELLIIDNLLVQINWSEAINYPSYYHLLSYFPDCKIVYLTGIRLVFDIVLALGTLWLWNNKLQITD